MRKYAGPECDRFRPVVLHRLPETCNGWWAAAMAERKHNGGGGAASTSSSGTNLLFSSSATEFTFNVPFIPVTQAAAAPASLLLPGGSTERVPGGASVRGAGRGPAVTRVGLEVFLRSPPAWWVAAEAVGGQCERRGCFGTRRRGQSQGFLGAA